MISVVPFPNPPKDLASVVERQPGLLSVKDLQILTGFKRTAIYDKVAAGRIPYLRFGATIKFDPIAIAAWMRDHTIGKAA